MTLDTIREKAVPVLQANNVEYAAVFGSAARGEDTADSDIDLLIRYKVSPGLFAHVGLAQDLQSALGKKVDLVTEGSLKKALVPNVKKDLRVLYGQTQRPGLY